MNAPYGYSIVDYRGFEVCRSAFEYPDRVSAAIAGQQHADRITAKTDEKLAVQIVDRRLFSQDDFEELPGGRVVAAIEAMGVIQP